MSLRGYRGLKESFILDDFMVTSSILYETRNGGKRFGQKGGFSLQKSSNLLTKKNMTWTLDPLLSYKYVIISRKLEIMNLTQPPPTFLLDVTNFTGFFFWRRPLVISGDDVKKKNGKISDIEQKGGRGVESISLFLIY